MSTSTIPPRIAGLVARSAVLFAPLVVACGGSERETPPPLSFNIPPADFEDDDPCTPPAKGCDCVEPGTTAECGTITRHSADYVTCTYGVVTCGEDFEWGECMGDEISALPIPETGAK